MKRLFKTIFFASCLGIMTFSVSSCLNDDDDSQTGLTHAQKATYVNSLVGSYSGKLYFYPKQDYNNGTTGDMDSVAINWHVSLLSDTTATCVSNNYDVSVLGKYTSLISNSDARAILLAAEPQKYIAAIQPFYLNEYSFAYYLLPNYDGKALTSTSTSDLQKLSYTVTTDDGTEHKVVLTFAYYLSSGSYYLYPVAYYSSSYKKFLGYILLRKVSVDGSEYDLNAIQLLSATKS